MLLAMDHSNLREIEDFRSRSRVTARVALLGSFDPQGGVREVPDPYHNGLDAFEAVYAQVERCCRGLITAHPQAKT